MERSIAVLTFALFASALPGALHAQPIDLSGGGPVEVTSVGGFEWRENEQIVIATGDARAVRGNVTVLADRLIARYRKKAGGASAPTPAAATAAAPGAAANPTDVDNGGNEVYRLEAHGHVRILTETDEAVGDDAIYDIDQAVLLMTGHAMKLTTPQDVLTARDTMEYWSQQHMAVGRGNAVVVTNDGRRIAADVLVAYTTEGDTPAATGTQAAAPRPAPNGSAKPGSDPLADSGKLKRVDAFGNVEVRTAVDIVRGDRGVYIPETGIARVVDNVRVTHGSSQTHSCAADINMKTGVARLSSCAGSRVKGLIVPNDAQNAQPGLGGAAPAKR